MFVFLFVVVVLLSLFCNEALDFVVSEANKYGLRLILSLENNYVNFGGKAQYVQWASYAGHNLHSEDDFFTNRTVKSYYKNHN